MPCDFERFVTLTLALAMLLAMPLAGIQERPSQDGDRPAAQAPPSSNAIDRWNQMSPEERERELAKLPPARAKQIRQRIQRYNQMHPEEQQALRERYQTFSQLPQEKRQLVRARLREFRQLPAERRPIVHREVEQMRLLPEPQRQARLNSEDFRNRFSADERQIVRDLSTYLPN
jgi:hypothetical protein